MSSNQELQAKVEELEARIAQLTAPKPSSRRKAPTVTVDGVVLMDQPARALTMKRLAAASKRNLERVVPLRLKAAGVEFGRWRFVEAQGVAPLVEVELLAGGEPVHYSILAGPGDYTDYYLVREG